MFASTDQHRRLAVVLPCLTVLLTACGGDDQEGIPSCEALAPTVAGCDPQTTQEEWRAFCALTVLSSECREAIADATCEDHAAEIPPYQATCFPACDPPTTAAVCNADDTLTQCVPVLGGLVTYRCAAVCTTVGRRYTGVCGAEYQGRLSGNGEAVCWCE